MEVLDGLAEHLDGLEVMHLWPLEDLLVLPSGLLLEALTAVWGRLHGALLAVHAVLLFRGGRFPLALDQLAALQGRGLERVLPGVGVRVVYYYKFYLKEDSWRVESESFLLELVSLLIINNNNIN